MRPNTYHYNPADGDPSTWVNGKPGGGSTTDPGTTTAPEDPGTTVDPGAATDPGAGEPVTPPVTEPAPPSDSGIAPIDPNQAAG